MMPKSNEKMFNFYVKGIQYKSIVDKKTGIKRHFLKGHIDSEDVDMVDESVTRSCMADMSKQFKSRSIKLDFDHETLRKAKEDEESNNTNLHLTKSPLGKSVSETLDKKGNLVEFELNPSWDQLDEKNNIVKTFDETIGEVKSGFLDSFSIAFIPVRTMIKKVGEKSVKLLDKINLINVALTGNPINPKATITNVMMKSLKHMNTIEGKRKEYEKDGPHAHTENEPLGEHRHSELEMAIVDIHMELNQRIEFLHDRINDIKNPSDEASVAGLKSKINKKGDGNMPEEEGQPQEGSQENPDTSESTDGAAAEEGAAAEGSDAGDSGEADAGNAEASGKSVKIDGKAIMKSIDGLTKEIKDLKEKSDAHEKILGKAVNKGQGAESASTVEDAAGKSEVSEGPLDNI